MCGIIDGLDACGLVEGFESRCLATGGGSGLHNISVEWRLLISYQVDDC